MEEELNTINTEIVEDMPDFEENTAEIPCEDAESVDKCTDNAENEILSEENADENADTEGKTEEKPSGTAEKKEEDFKNNLPTGFSFNPLQLAIRPLYERAIAEDELFAKEVKEKESRKEKPKSLAECADFLMGEAYEYASKHRNGNFGLAGMSDDELMGLIKHYYDEEDIVIRKMGAGVRAKVATTKTTAKTEKKVKEKPKQKANVIDITKAITAKPKTENGKKAKREKKKDNLFAGFVPMERPDAENYEKEAKKGSREQAKSVEQMDMFADFFATEE